MPKPEKMSVSTCVRKHLICELWLTEYYVDTSSSIAFMCGQGLLVMIWEVRTVLPHRLTGNHYRDFLLHDLPKLLKYVPLAVRALLWYLHDGASAHSSRAERDVLSNSCHERWIGRGGPTVWPPRSPDLNPLECYLLRQLRALVCAAPVDNEEALTQRVVDACQTIRNYLRQLRALVCAAPVDNEEALTQRIVDACQTIRNYHGIFERMQRSMMGRVEACIESHGGHFQHLL
jgi:hypothetical protein